MCTTAVYSLSFTLFSYSRELKCQRLALEKQLSWESNIACLWLWPYETLSLKGKLVSEELQLHSLGWEMKYLFYIVSESMRHTFKLNISCAFWKNQENQWWLGSEERAFQCFPIDGISHFKYSHLKSIVIYWRKY